MLIPGNAGIIGHCAVEDAVLGSAEIVKGWQADCRGNFIST